MTSDTTPSKKPDQALLAAPAARHFALERAAIDKEARTVELAFSSQEPYDRWFGIEVLSHEAGAIRMGRLMAGGALLMDHNTRDQVGVVESVSVGTDRVARAKVRFGKSARADEIFNDVQDGIRRNVSVGYVVHKWEVKDGQGDAPSTYTALDWEPLEVSLVSVPADPTVGVGRGLTDQQAQHLSREFGLAAPAVQTERKAEPAPSAPPAPSQPAQPKEPAMSEKTPEQIQTEARAAAQADALKATTAIISLGEQFARHGGDKLASEYLRSGKCDPSEFQRQLLEKIGTAGSDTTKGEIGLSTQQVKQFSFLRAMNWLSNPQDRAAFDAAAFERECSEEARKKHGSRQGVGITIPVDVLRAPMGRDLTVGSATSAGNLVSTDLLSASFIDLLRKRMLLQRLGVTTLNGLVGNVAIPRQSGAGTAYWVAESGAPTESQQTVDQVTLSPKTVGAYTDISRRLMLQSSIDVEMMVRNDLTKVIALEVDRAGLYGSGSSNQPLGLKNQSGINTKDFAADAPTYAEIVALESEVAADDADVGSLAYAVNAIGRGALKTTSKDTGSGMFLWEQGNTVNGYRAEVSNQVASGDFWFGNWSDLVLGFWSGLDLLVDPYSNSTSGTVRVVVLQDVDVAIRHPESFCRGNNTL